MKKPHTRPIIGIDLGTTYSLCAVLQGDKPVVLPNALGETLTPSAVSLDDDGHVLVGAPARARATTHPNLTALAFKRDMGCDKSYQLGPLTLRPEQLSALVLSELKRDAEHTLGQEIAEAVITVPAYFGDAQREATRTAGELAGFRVERIINEPTAAALAYGLHARDRELRAVVLDLGGGTFDVTVLEIIDGVIEVQASAGDARLGGEDFVDVLMADVLRSLAEREHIELESPVAQARLREALERVKRTLSQAHEARLVLLDLETTRGPKDVDMPITRAQAERAFLPLLERLRQPIARAMRDASLKPSDIDEVLLVGGATRMPCFVELAARTFARMPNRHLPADEAVAMGAAVQAALKEGKRAVEDLVVTDVAPFSLGISSITRYGNRHVEGVFSPIIERGTTIPVSRSERFFTVVDNQEKIHIEVYQGEHSLCRDNVKLGEYTVENLPPMPAGHVSVEVRFTYDLNGILEVETSVEGSEQKSVLVLEQRPGRLSAQELAAARRAMQGLKFHARDALPNRVALARADALYRELTGAARKELGAAIATMRSALETQDPELIRERREHLVASTEALRRMG